MTSRQVWKPSVSKRNFRFSVKNASFAAIVNEKNEAL